MLQRLRELRERRRRRHLLRTTVTSLLRSSDERIIAGPWLGEVGFELLYWIPLLRWCVDRWPELKERLVVVSRGRVAGWYEGIADTYVDLFERYDRGTFAELLRHERDQRRERGQSLKQLEETEWEREIAVWVRERLGDPGLAMLHPSIMFHSLMLIQSFAESSEVAFDRWRTPERGPLEATLVPGSQLRSPQLCLLVGDDQGLS